MVLQCLHELNEPGEEIGRTHWGGWRWWMVEMMILTGGKMWGENVLKAKEDKVKQTRGINGGSNND